MPLKTSKKKKFRFSSKRREDKVPSTKHKDVTNKRVAQFESEVRIGRGPEPERGTEPVGEPDCEREPEPEPELERKIDRQPTPEPDIVSELGEDAKPEPKPETTPQSSMSKEVEEEKIIELELADDCFIRNDFVKAISLYNEALIACKDKWGEMHVVVGNIHVKIATIHQGEDRLKEALEHLNKAREIYGFNVTQFQLGQGLNAGVERWIEIITNVANIHVDLSENEKAYDTYQETLELSRQYLPKNHPHISTTLNNYANFLSICRGDHDKAILTFKEALKVQHENSLGKIDLQTAGTLSNMGKVYMRKSKMSNGIEGKSDARKAESCFERALHLYRMSMIRSGNEKVAETLYNLSEAREWQNQRKGILRNVQFDAPAVAPTPSYTSHTVRTEEECSQYTTETMEDDLEKYSRDSSCLFQGEGVPDREGLMGGCLYFLRNPSDSDSDDTSSILIDEKDLRRRSYR